MPDPAKKITQARVAMLFSHPFFGYLAISLEPKEKTDLKPPTMATDGTHLFYHPDFVNNTPFKQLQGVIAHEIGHVILNHLSRHQGREAKRWNVAADYTDNYIVAQEFELPDNVLRNPDYDNKSAEFIYNDLPVQVVEMPTLDSHDGWGDWGKDADGKDDPSMEGRWQEAVAQAATQARMQGKLPAHLEAIVGEILQPKLDWKSILRDLVTSSAKTDYRLFPSNKKHIHRGFYLPGITGTTIDIAFAIDTSGSIPDAEIQQALSEVVGICESYDDYTIYLYECDAAIQKKIELRPGDPVPMVVSGRGGTDFRPVFEDIQNSQLPISSLVYMTDLYGSFPDREPEFATVWLVTTEGNPPWGYTVRYPDETNRGRRK